MSDYSVIPPRPKPSMEEFRAFVSMRLTAAMEAIPDSVPFGMMDPVAQPLQQPLQAIEDYLYELDVEERRQEDREESRERKVAAKRRDASVEELVRQIDHWVQKAVEALGISRAQFLDGIIIDGLLRWVVRLLDKFDPAALKADHIYSRGGADPRIAAIVEVLRTTSAGRASPKDGDTIRSGLSTSQRVVLRWLHDRRWVSCDLPNAYTLRSLRALQRRGYVSSAGGAWRVTSGGHQWIRDKTGGVGVRGPIGSCVAGRASNDGGGDG